MNLERIYIDSFSQTSCITHISYSSVAPLSIPCYIFLYLFCFVRFIWLLLFLGFQTTKKLHQDTLQSLEVAAALTFNPGETVRFAAT